MYLAPVMKTSRLHVLSAILLTCCPHCQHIRRGECARMHLDKSKTVLKASLKGQTSFFFCNLPYKHIHWSYFCDMTSIFQILTTCRRSYNSALVPFSSLVSTIRIDITVSCCQFLISKCVVVFVVVVDKS
jgi:hypothetical protein